ncbi:MAG: type II secretion system GspH family protein [Bacteroidales bacterium]|nr:type II secretion system GspH family protein [Bacteroidales bacterium]
MKLSAMRVPPTARRGFSLIELLIVMAIIAILAGMLMAGVQRARTVARRTSAANDISQLAAACQAFKQQFGFYPPDTYTIPAGTPTDSDPLKRMFPRGNFSGALPGAGTTLTQAETLTFFLGGPGMTGWDPQTPANTNPAGATKKGPYFDFPANRVSGHTFLDPWGTPYVYFRSVNGNDYGGTFTAGGVSPYKQNGRDVNQNSVQIISAGANKAFGPGGPWSPGGTGYSEAEAGFDDMANFNQGALLGVQVTTN